MQRFPSLRVGWTASGRGGRANQVDSRLRGHRDLRVEVRAIRREALRALRAIGPDSKPAPTVGELQEAESTEAVEKAVRETTNQIAPTVASCVASYGGSRNLSGRIVFEGANQPAP